jgi:putative ABC transport system permease protein
MLTVVAATILTALIALLWTVDRSLRTDWGPQEAQRLVIQPKTQALLLGGLPIALLDRIRQLPGVKAVTPYDLISARWRDDRGADNFQKVAVEAIPYLQVHVEATVSAEDRQAWLEDPTGAAVAEGLARRIGLHRGDRVVLRMNQAPAVLELTIRAIIRCKRDAGLYFHRRYLEEKIGKSASSTGFYWAIAETPADVPRLARAIDALFENSPSPTRSEPERQFQLKFISMLGNVQALLAGVGLVAGATLALITSNTLAMGARERRAEDSLLRVLGFSRMRVCALLLLESAFYGLAGGALGVALAAVLLQLLIGSLEGTMIAQVIALLRLDWGVSARALGASLLLSLVAGTYPAIAAGSGSLASQLRKLA